MFHASMIFLCVLPWAVWRAPGLRRMRLVLATAAVTLVTMSSPPWWAPSPRAQWVPIALIGLLIALLVTTLIGVTAPIRIPRWMRKIAKPMFACSLAVLACVAAFQVTKRVIRIPTSRIAVTAETNIAPRISKASYDRSWRDTKAWLAAHTASDAVLLLPPCLRGYLAKGLMRSPILSDTVLGGSIYDLASTTKEVRTLKLLFDIDLAAMDRAQVVRLTHQSGGRLNLLDRGYLDLTSDMAHLLRVKRAYPNLRYVVAAEPGSYLPDFCTTIKSDRPPAPFPVAYQNAHYAILDLGQ